MLGGINPLMMAQSGGLRPQDVFLSALVTGTGTSQNIPTVDLATYGGLAWLKARSTSQNHYLTDTLRGGSLSLNSNATSAQAGALAATFGTSSYNVVGINSGENYVNWSFRRAARFFDVVTYTGDGVSGRQITHALGVAPGMIIVKALAAGLNWAVYHRSIGATGYLYLNATGAQSPGPTASIYWNNTAASDTIFTLGAGDDVNAGGVNYVAYLFAHDTDASGIVQCGSYATNSSAVGGAVNLGWRPQFLIAKPATVSGSWYMADTARGWTSGGGGTEGIEANTSAAEVSLGTSCYPTSTGFVDNGTFYASATMLYLAIREPL